MSNSERKYEPQEVSDGNKDIIIAIQGKEFIVIKEEAYKAVGLDYEAMKSVKMMGAVLIGFGQQLLDMSKELEE